MSEDAQVYVSKRAARRRTRRFGGLVLGLILLAAAVGWVVVESGQDLSSSFLSAWGSVATQAVLALVAALLLVGVGLRWRGTRVAARLHKVADDLSRGFDQGTSEGLSAPQLKRLEERIAQRAGGRVWDTLEPRWRELRGALLKRDDAYFRRIEATEIFREDAIEGDIKAGWPWLGVQAPYSFVHELPGFMLGLGMLGTFIGIAMGLGQLSSAAGDSERIVDEIGPVIAGMASAFWTSIVGLAASSLTIWRNHHADTALDLALAELCRQLDGAIPLATGENFLEQQVDLSDQQVELSERQVELSEQQVTLAEQTRKELLELRVLQEQANSHLGEMANELADSLGATLRPLLEDVANAVRQQVANSAAPMIEMFDQVREKLVASLEGPTEKIGQQMAAVASMFEQAGGQLGKTLEGAATRFDESITAAASNLDGALTASVDSAAAGFDQMQGKLVTTLERANSQLGNMATITASRVSTSVRAMETGVDAMRSKLVESFGEVSGKLEQTLEGAAARLDESITTAASNIDSAIAASADKAAAGFDQMQGKLVTSLDQANSQLGNMATTTATRVSTSVRAMESGVDAMRDRLVESFGEVSGRLAAEMKSALEQALAALHTATAESTRHFDALLKPLLQSMRALHGISASLDAREKAYGTLLDQQQALLDRQQVIAREMNEALTGLAPSLRTVAQHSDVIARAASTLDSASKRLQATQAALVRVSDGIQTGLVQSAESFSTTVDALETFVATMQGWMGQTAVDIERFAATMSTALGETLGRYDEHLARSVKQLAGVGGGLTEAAERIAADVRQLGVRA